MVDIIQLDEDKEYLIMKVVPVSSVKRKIDWKALGITKEYINEQSKLKLTWDETAVDHKGNKVWHVDKRVQPTTPEEVDRFYVTELCLPYNPPPDDRDVFVFYNDIGFLSGTAGYIRLRDGYVYGQKITVRS